MPDVIAYCVKEKKKQPMKDVREITFPNGRHAFQGICASCGTKMTKFISDKKETADQSKVSEANQAAGRPPAKHKPRAR